MLTLAQQSNSGGGIIGVIFMLIWLAVVVLIVAGLWKMIAKAGEPGWACLVPIYNYYILLKIVGRPWWWLLLMLIPLVNLVVGIIVAVDLAKSFGKDVAFAVGLILLPPVFVCILGFGSAKYVGPAARR